MRSSRSPSILPNRVPPSLQGHVLATQAIGDAYYWGKGVAIDYPRAMAAYKIAAEAGDALSQFQVGLMYCKGLGVAVDYERARPWLEKAAAQDYPNAVGQLGLMAFEGKGVTPSWRRARELYQRAIELGDSRGAEYEGNNRYHRKCTSHTTPTPQLQLRYQYPQPYY